MKVLVTGSQGFIGKNLCAALDSLAQGFDRRERFSALAGLELLECTSQTTADELGQMCAVADFAVHLAGANRPEDPADFERVNAGFTRTLVDALESAGNRCPILLASSAQATLEGRYAGSAYGASKLEAERIVLDRAERTGAPGFVYRFPNVYGKWCRPNYNSVVATLCHNTARGIPTQINDPSVELELLFVGDLVEEVLRVIADPAGRASGLQPLPATSRRSLGGVAALVEELDRQLAGIVLPIVEPGTFEHKLLSTFVSYLPVDRLFARLPESRDHRGSFVELARTPGYGQVSLNRIVAGGVKGNHWHQAKWEIFYALQGTARVALEPLHGDGGILRFDLDGTVPSRVIIPPGYTHSMANASPGDPMPEAAVLIWADEEFDPAEPDTFFKEVR